MSAYYRDDHVTLLLGDTLDVLPTLPDASVDAIVTDPPYALRDLPTALVVNALTEWLDGNRSFVPTGQGFMSRNWDGFVPPPAAWDECMRVLKPGGKLLAFAAPRTADLMGMSIRLAGFQILDGIDWFFGSGFPKSKNHLKPAHEPIAVARRPLSGTVAETVLQHGTGALNIDGCRVEPTGEGRQRNGEASQGRRYADRGGTDFAPLPGTRGGDPAGRWPTNVVLSHPPLLDADGYPIGDACADGCVDGCPVAEMDRQSGERRTGGDVSGNEPGARFPNAYGDCAGRTPYQKQRDPGGASKFFPVFRYEAKARASERPRLPDGTAWPTVKPLALMRWLVRLITPPGGVVLDPFAGTGTTLEAALLEDFYGIGIERDPTAADLTVVRLSKPIQTGLFGEAS